MRVPIITTWRVRRAEAAQAAWLAAIRDFEDPALKQRLAGAVDASLEACPADLLVVDTDETSTLTSAFWGALNISAQRTDSHSTRCPDRHYWIHTEGSDPDAGPWLFASVDDDYFRPVRWMPGGGFDTPQAFLDWFEAMAVKQR